MLQGKGLSLIEFSHEVDKIKLMHMVVSLNYFRSMAIMANDIYVHLGMHDVTRNR